MYPIDPIHPTELYRERRELLAQEARLAGQLRAARRELAAASGRRTSGFGGRAMALLGGTSVPFFRA